MMATEPATSPIRTGWSRRVHAWCLAHCVARYERMVADRKRALLSALQGDILEIGPGAGPNLAYYPDTCHWIGVEPNPYLYPYLRKAAERRGLQIEIRAALAEELPAADDSVNTVVSTLVLCSVTDPAATLREIFRVLKPGGRFVFIEHVAAPRGTRLRRVQELIRPVWKVIADGCHPNRETWTAIEQTGFRQVHYDHFQLPLGPVGPQIAGYAVK